MPRRRPGKKGEPLPPGNAASARLPGKGRIECGFPRGRAEKSAPKPLRKAFDADSEFACSPVPWKKRAKDGVSPSPGRANRARDASSGGRESSALDWDSAAPLTSGAGPARAPGREYTICYQYCQYFLFVACGRIPPSCTFVQHFFFQAAIYGNSPAIPGIPGAQA